VAGRFVGVGIIPIYYERSAPAGESRLTCAHELLMFPGYYHELLHEPRAERPWVLDTLDRWFDQRSGG
jgi:alpha-beta hydrolase superfamily lysophospholipase